MTTSGDAAAAGAARMSVATSAAMVGESLRIRGTLAGAPEVSL